MPWCPNCRNEYQEGITVCADCGATLVDELPAERNLAVLAYIETEELSEKLIEYLKFSELEAEYSYNEGQCAYEVRVEEADLVKAKAAFTAFYRVETSNAATEQVETLKEKILKARAAANLSEEEEINEEILDSIPEEELSSEEKDLIRSAMVAKEVYKPTEVYVKKKDVSRDMFSTAVTFLFFAVVLLALLVLSVLDIVTIFSGVPSLVMLGALSIGCCIVGINAIQRSKKAEAASVEEDKLTDEINNWLATNIDETLFADIDEEELGTEIAYLKKTELIKARLLAQYPGLEENFADSLVEEFYDKSLDAKA